MDAKVYNVAHTHSNTLFSFQFLFFFHTAFRNGKECLEYFFKEILFSLSSYIYCCSFTLYSLFLHTEISLRLARNFCVHARKFLCTRRKTSVYTQENFCVHARKLLCTRRKIFSLSLFNFHLNTCVRRNIFSLPLQAKFTNNQSKNNMEKINSRIIIKSRNHLKI
jgi:hypothetical protein